MLTCKCTDVKCLPSGPDWYVPVPDTGRLDSSAQIARAQLAQKSKRHPPSRDKLRESFRKQVGSGATMDKFTVPHSTGQRQYLLLSCVLLVLLREMTVRGAHWCRLQHRPIQAAEARCRAPRPFQPSAHNFPPAPSLPRPSTLRKRLPHPINPLNPGSPKGNFHISGEHSFAVASWNHPKVFGTC